MAEKKTTNEQQSEITSPVRTFAIGFWGGLIWGFLGFISYYLNFAKYGPGLILAPWALGKWKVGLKGQILGIIAITILSIVIAFIYRAVLGKVKNIWISVGFGMVLWVIVFYIIQPWIPGLKPVLKLGLNTISTSLCLYVLYGLFIGYSISFDLQMKQSSDYSNE
ncbi:YqhR family membrane protein [Pullulanibacillus sp. KACC 23026]|uniref:YqhR family membrane protein n=1 Tax=Pullulanibacillus sp. KACC 23026 TaxID=3028315 RepID=UPI0023B191AD|nr:YqhR family membrane protein [Pullulanibacillus sp. KACC 23026]WEG14304.1 YqhR family membrane protein [Pullulanibacillus sp. KACC 23026]